MRKPSGTWRRAYMVRTIRSAPVSRAMDRATSLTRSTARARLWRRSPAWLRPPLLKPASVPAKPRGVRARYQRRGRSHSQSSSAGPLHGYAITDLIRRLSDDALLVEEGTLYLALWRLENRGCLTRSGDCRRTIAKPSFIGSPRMAGVNCAKK
jgi:hypothetical protein